MRTRVVTALVLIAATVTFTQAHQSKTTDEAITVPMLDAGGRPVIEVKINGAGPYRMVIDTGASNTVIDPSYNGGATGSATLTSFEIGALRMENVRVRSQALLGGNVPEDFPKGVVSAAMFPGYLVTFDFPARTITFRRGALPAADGKRIFEYSANEVLPVAPIRVAGREFVIHVDTGSPGGVMLPLRYGKELPLTGELTLAGKARTGAGEFEMFAGTINGAIEIGEFPIESKDVRFSDLRPGPLPGIGNMGSALLKAFRLTFDSANRRLKFER